MKKLGLCLAIAMTFSASQVALANDKPKKVYPGPGYGDQFDSLGASSLREMAKCIVQFARKPAERLLTTRPRSTQEYNQLRSISGRLDMCFPNGIESITFSYMELRGFLAEVLYINNHPVDPDFSRLSHGQVPWPAEWMTASNQVNYLLPVYMMQFGSCVAAADPKGAAALVRTEVRTKEEKTAIERLKPSLGPCLDSGRTFQVDAAILRALTAQGLYRSVGEWLRSPVAANVPQKAAN